LPQCEPFKFPSDGPQWITWERGEGERERKKNRETDRGEHKKERREKKNGGKRGYGDSRI